MSDMQFRVVPFVDYKDMANKWDVFVMNESVNGTFLQTRRFLSYHPSDRFIDASFVILDNKDNWVAVSPGCEVYEDDRKVFYSHKGSTYGGIIISKKHYKTKYVVSIIEKADLFLINNGFSKTLYRITPDILSTERSALLEYAFYHAGYIENKELNLYIDYSHYGEDVKSMLSQGKRTNVNNCEKAGVQVRSLLGDSEIAEFYEILCENLSKYGIKPVHTVDELLDFKDNRLQNECEFFGVYIEDKMVAGGMLFYFEQTNTAHTQYLCSRQLYNKLSPMTYLYYWLICEMRRREYEKLSWGICTEENGMIINEGLVSSKESFGGTYGVNKICFKSLC